MMSLCKKNPSLFEHKQNHFFHFTQELSPEWCQSHSSRHVSGEWHQVLSRFSSPSCTKSIKRCVNPSYQNRLVKALDFGGVFRYTYLYEKVTSVEISLRVLLLISS